MTAAERAARTEEADRLCRSAFSSSVSPVTDAAGSGVALVAVGGYGRGELAPCSDLDVVLVHDPAVDVGDAASRLWYPLWDADVTLDHSVRALDEVARAAAADIRVALGLIDARHLAGDSSVSLRLRTEVLGRWRRDARQTLPRLRELVRERSARVAELAHAAVPDLKESTGGLRDATVLNALVATWLVDVPHADLERCRVRLLDVRDCVQAAAGRASDRVVPELWAPVAELLGLADEEEAQRLVRRLGRRTTHLSRLTWSRVDRVLAPPPPAARGRRPLLEPVARGVAVAAGEVVLDRGADPATDPLLLLRAAVAAAERRLMLAPATAARLAAGVVPLPVPWPAEARELLVRLLAAGPGLLAVWETLDETGALDPLLPEWQRVRLLPHASSVHRFTVDRHLVETCVEAGRMVRRVSRPDLLLVAALLHDLGKGGPGDHSAAGEPVAAAVATRLGFAPGEVATIAALVRWHLLLPATATSRDLDDPATSEHVVARVRDLRTLDLLELLTEADARATSPKAWTVWRAALVADLSARVRTALAGPPRVVAPTAASSPPDSAPGKSRQAEPRGPTGPEPPFDVDLSEVSRDPSYVRVEVAATDDGALVRVTAADRVGLMADVAGTLTLLRLPVRSARAWTVEHGAVSEWSVAGQPPDPAVLGQRLDRVVRGEVDPTVRLRVRPDALPPVVVVRHEASRRATVLEVRTQDQPGVVFLVCRALAGLGLSVRSAHVSTVGPQTLDVFYLQEAGEVPLTEDRAASAAHAVRRALETAATLDV
ncbi:MAG TPA: [protein-PII] uridylyltransferase [Marmoricola sp.]|nr:[protein-PII] uridylyltransferase [Marmoricola sp.]